MININSLTFSYNKREDRIYIVINHEEFDQRIDFAITRSKMIELLSGFDEILINNCNNGEIFKHIYKEQEDIKVVKSSEKQASKNTWEKNVTKANANFTKIKKAIILDSLSYTITNHNINLKFITLNEQVASSTMDLDMFQKTLSSMMRVIPFVAWGISPHILD
jgi:hypothetical protein